MSAVVLKDKKTLFRWLVKGAAENWRLVMEFHSSQDLFMIILCSNIRSGFDGLGMLPSYETMLMT
jgi:hypothetical protein